MLPYDPAQLKTIEECKRVLKKVRELGDDEAVTAVFRRQVELSLPTAHPDRVTYPVDDPNDPMVRDFHHGLIVYEQVLSEKNGRPTSARRTRDMLQRGKPIRKILEDWARRSGETPGFEILVKRGLPQHTGEYELVKYFDQFPEDVVQRARARLLQHGVALP
jgi:hypothetical protein